jgi:hypothetical protein
MATPVTRLPRPRREPTKAELDAFVARLGKWLADVAAKQGRAA